MRFEENLEKKKREALFNEKRENMKVIIMKIMVKDILYVIHLKIKKNR